MRSWITYTIGSESPCAVGTTEYLRGFTGRGASYFLVPFGTEVGVSGFP